MRIPYLCIVKLKNRTAMNTNIDNMSKEEKCEQLTQEYMVLMNYPLTIAGRVHNAAAKRFSLTVDECVECLHEAERRKMKKIS